MANEYTFKISSPSEVKVFSLPVGSSMHFVGANGCGKTRLAVEIENQLGLQCLRISAHRALNLNPSVTIIREEKARNKLRTGNIEGNSADIRKGHRYHNKAATCLLNDFEQLMQTLYAEQANTKNAAYDQAKLNNGYFDFNKEPLLETLKTIWEKLLPHRKLIITADNIKVSPLNAQEYCASEMSDGERSIFYLIGHVLCADKNSVIIIDEPELHLHESIILALWDELESKRSDCSFIYISHDLDFIASRVGQKFVILAYHGESQWTFQYIPENTGFSEETVTSILGSRKPILFVEGTNNSLDAAIYRACFPDCKVITKGSCQEVIHAVATFRNNQELTRLTCAGIVDTDARSSEDIAMLEKLGIGVLPVSEIENIFLLPEVARAIGQHESLVDPELTKKINEMNKAIIAHVRDNLEQTLVNYCRRQIDRILKRIDLSAGGSVSEIERLYKESTSTLKIESLAKSRRECIERHIEENNISGLLSVYDNKGMLSVISNIKNCKLDAFKDWIVRVLRDKEKPAITDAIKNKLPIVQFE